MDNPKMTDEKLEQLRQAIQSEDVLYVEDMRDKKWKLATAIRTSLDKDRWYIRAYYQEVLYLKKYEDGSGGFFDLAETRMRSISDNWFGDFINISQFLRDTK